MACGSSDSSPTIVFVSKMFAVEKTSLPQNMSRLLYVCVYVCMYVCMYVCTSSLLTDHSLKRNWLRGEREPDGGTCWQKLRGRELALLIFKEVRTYVSHL